MQNETAEISQDEIKAFMNEPEPVETPAPMFLDDLAPGHEDGSPDQIGKLTTEEMTNFALTLAIETAERLGHSFEYLSNPVEWTNLIINSAANPNGYEICREIYENDLMIAREQCQYWIPFSKLPIQDKMPYFVYRSTIVTLLGVWAGY